MSESLRRGSIDSTAEAHFTVTPRNVRIQSNALQDEASPASIRMDMRRLPLEIWELVADHMQRNVSNLRLASRTFHDCATPSRFRYLSLDVKRVIERPALLPDWSARINGLTKSGLLRYVHKLSIRYPHSLMPATQVDHFEAVTNTLPDLAAACINLEVLALDFSPAFPFNSVLGQMCSAVTSHSRVKGPFKLRLEAHSGSTWIDTLTPLHPLSSLSTESGLGRFVGNLRHMDITVSMNQFERQAQLWRYINYAWSLIDNAPELRTLRIENWHSRINLNLTAFETGGPRDLREISFSKVMFSEANFTNFVSRHSSTLRKIQLLQIDLEYGSWLRTFVELCKLSNLEYFTIVAGGYHRLGPPLTLSEEDLQDLVDRGITDPELDIRTNDKNEYLALGQLQQHINTVRSSNALTPLDSETCQYARLPPLIVET